MQKNKKRVAKIILGIAIVSSLKMIDVKAYSGYAGADENVPSAAFQAENAKYYLDRSGYDTNLYIGSSFTKQSVRSVVPSVRVFYVSCHGSQNVFVTHPTSSVTESIDSNEMYSWTRGFYKFVFIDSCHSADTKQFYYAFNMVDGDGLNNAFLGWKGTTPSGGISNTFSTTVFQRLTAGDTVNDAVWLARCRTGLTNYQIYGNYKTTLYN